MNTKNGECRDCADEAYLCPKHGERENRCQCLPADSYGPGLICRACFERSKKDNLKDVKDQMEADWRYRQSVLGEEAGPDKVTVKSIIDLTKGAYGADAFAGFFKAVK